MHATEIAMRVRTTEVKVLNLVADKTEQTSAPRTGSAEKERTVMCVYESTRSQTSVLRPRAAVRSLCCVVVVNVCVYAL